MNAMTIKMMLVAGLLALYGNKGFSMDADYEIPGTVYAHIGMAVAEAKSKGVSVSNKDISVRVEGAHTYISFYSPSMPPPAKGQRGSPEGFMIFGVELRNGEVVRSQFVR